MKRKIVIAGGTGLVGSRMVELLDKDKYDIYILTRSSRASENGIQYIQWDTDNAQLDLTQLGDIYAIINLTGAGIADKRWTESRKEIILKSRLNAARTLAKGLSDATVKPDVYLAASAIGYYGDRADEKLYEDSTAGEGFLSEVCQQWEAEHDKLNDMFQRTSILRIGIVLSSKGGALAEILKTTKTGIYGYFGDGSAYYSWIHIDDLCRMFIHVMERSDAEGIYNATAEVPITIKTLVKEIKTANNSAGLVLPVPMMALKLALGEIATMLNTSMRVIPRRILESRFEFKFDKAENAVRDILAKKI